MTTEEAETQLVLFFSFDFSYFFTSFFSVDLVHLAARCTTEALHRANFAPPQHFCRFILFGMTFFSFLQCSCMLKQHAAQSMCFN